MPFETACLIVFLQEVILKMGNKLLVFKGGDICLVMRQQFDLENNDGGLGVVYQNYRVDLDREYSRDL